MTKNYPFHCGTQFADWEESNCCQCRKNAEPDKMPTCPIQYALIAAMFDDGSVSDEIAERMGYAENKGHYNWRCKEFEDASQPPALKPLPGQREMFE